MRNYHRLDEIQKDLYNHKTTCRELVSHYLGNIKEYQDLNAFLEIYEEEALRKADAIDKKIKDNKAGKLAGLIFGIKDLLCYQNHKVSGASKILESFESLFTGTAVQRLLDEDAIVIGRQNCDEFGMGSTNENSAFGLVKNGLDQSKVPGGSSGGSAVAVQMDMCQISLGTDTGGSVRQPAGFCGVIGLKPTYSRISRWGLLAYASSFDTIGIFSKSIYDNQRVLSVIAGQDPKDATSSSRDLTDKPQEAQHYKVAVLNEATLPEGLQEEVNITLHRTISDLEALGHKVDRVAFPLMEYVLPTYYILTTAEASTNLSRYDGAHYGHRSPMISNLESMYKLSRTEGLGDEVRRRIMLGTFVLSADYYDAYFTKAQKARRLILDATNEILENYDFILIPTSGTTAFKIGKHEGDPLAMYMSDLMTVQASVTGLPAISIPVSNDKSGMPIGMQIISKAFDEEKLFAISKELLKESQIA